MKSLGDFASAWTGCWICDETRDLQIHHICGRRGKNPHDPRNLFRICARCHALHHDGSRTDRTINLEHILYAKRAADPENYDPEYLASLRGKKHLGVEPKIPDFWDYDIEFAVDLKPVPQPRPRITRRGPPRAYVPSDHPIHGFRSAVAAAAAVAGCCITGRPVTLSVSAMFARPKSHLKKSAKNVPLLPPCDVDNIAKAVMDALTGVAYEDDRMVKRLLSEKDYAPHDRVVVRVSHAA